MKCKREMSTKFLILVCFFVSLEIHCTHTREQTIQLFPQASSVIGKTGSEVEMAFYTQILGFVNDEDEFGNSMLNFLNKYLQMRNSESAILRWCK